MEEAKEILQLITISDLVDIVGLFFVVIGAAFALYQWRKGNDYKRAEIVNLLIEKVRCDEEISSIMTLIDWSRWFEYEEGVMRFTQQGEIERVNDNRFNSIGNDELFERIDKSLSHFSYICYLNKRKCLSDIDMYSFEYEIKRLVDNKHIRNYLYSIYHWSNYLGTKCSFTYLIDYCFKRGWLNKNAFLCYPNRFGYECKLRIPNSYVQR